MAEGQPVIILGTGGNCIDILDALGEINAASGRALWRPLGFLDDDPGLEGALVEGLPVLGPLETARAHPEARFVNGIGSPRNHWRKPEIIAKTGLGPERFATIVHPAAAVSCLASLGRGVVVLQNATVASRAMIGDHVIILPSAVISHDDVIGDYACIAAGASVSGGVEVGRACYLGTNCCLRGGVRVGEGSLLGMGAVALEDIPPRQAWVGNPARFLRPAASSACQVPKGSL